MGRFIQCKDVDGNEVAVNTDYVVKISVKEDRIDQKKYKVALRMSNDTVLPGVESDRLHYVVESFEKRDDAMERMRNLAKS